MDKSKKGKQALIIVLSLFAFVVISTRVAAQTEQPFSYTQYMDNLAPINPAYSLLDQAGSLNTLASKQLIGINGSPTSFLINGDVPLPSITSSAGFSVLSDQLAIEKEIEVNAYFAKAIQVGPEDYLAVSLNAGLRNYTALYSSLEGTQQDQEFAVDVRQTKPNVGFGIMYYTDWYYIGLSVPELTITSLGTASVQNNNNNFSNHYYFEAAMLTSMGEDFKFKPAALVSYSSGVPVLADLSGTIYLKEILGVGVNFGTDKTMAGILTLNFDQFHVGYSYKFSIGAQDLGGVNNATNEVTLCYRFGKASSTPKLL